VGAGTPVVTTLSSPAIPELLGADGGLAVEERSPDTLAAAIRDVLAAPRPAATATRPDDADPLASARAYARLFARLAGKEA
jgi:glycosyltransferase involved in cell wall biosynthesis